MWVIFNTFIKLLLPQDASIQLHIIIIIDFPPIMSASFISIREIFCNLAMDNLSSQQTVIMSPAIHKSSSLVAYYAY